MVYLKKKRLPCFSRIPEQLGHMAGHAGVAAAVRAGRLSAGNWGGGGGGWRRFRSARGLKSQQELVSRSLGQLYEVIGVHRVSFVFLLFTTWFVVRVGGYGCES